MQAASVDPRDIRWEAHPTTYRVYFWTSDGTVCDEYELSDVLDVREVVAWVDEHADGRTAEISVRHDDHHGSKGLIRLAGARPGLE